MVSVKTNIYPWKRKKWKDVVSIDVRYTDRQRSKPQICIWRRTPAGKTMHIEKESFPSYFYIPQDNIHELDNISRELIPDSLEYTTVTALDGTKLLKLNWDSFTKEQFRNARECFSKTYEDDVKYVWRYLIDNDVNFTNKRRICFFDIENRMCLDIEKAPEPILSLAVYDNFNKTMGVLILDPRINEPQKLSKRSDGSFVLKYKKESDMLKGFISYIQTHNPDILCAYNLIGFDFPYIVNRMKRLGINYREMSESGNVWCMISDKDMDMNRCMCGGRELMDWYVLFDKLYDEDRPEDNKLDTVGEHILGKKKTVNPYKNLVELYEKDMNLFIEYNIQDVRLIVELEERVGFIMKYILSIQQMIPMNLDGITNNSVAIDFFILKNFDGKKIFPSKRNREHKRFPGAITGRLLEDPKTGEIIGEQPFKKMYKNCGVLDFSGLYPNLVRTFNISPETKVLNPELENPEDIITINGISFYQENEGLLPQLVGILMKLKKEYGELVDECDPSSQEYSIRYNMYMGVKGLINSLYGVLGYSGFRMYDTDVAKSITGFGQYMIKEVYKFLFHENNYEIIYGDTDSVFITLKCDVNDKEATLAEIDSVNKNINKRVAEIVDGFGSKRNHLEMDFEKRFTRVIFMGAKKRYIGFSDLWKGRFLEKDKFVVKGYDLVRRNMAKLCKEAVKTIIVMFLRDKPIEEIRKYYRDVTEKLKLSDIKDIAWSIGIGKNLDEYKKVLPAHVKAALVAKQYFNIDFHKGDSPKMMYVSKLPFKKPKYNKILDANGEVTGYKRDKKDIDAFTDVIGFTRDTEIPDYIMQKIDLKRFIDAMIIKKLNPFVGVEGIDMASIFVDDSKKSKSLGSNNGRDSQTYLNEIEEEDEIQ